MTEREVLDILLQCTDCQLVVLMTTSLGFGLRPGNIAVAAKVTSGITPQMRRDLEERMEETFDAWLKAHCLGRLANYG